MLIAVPPSCVTSTVAAGPRLADGGRDRQAGLAFRLMPNTRFAVSSASGMMLPFVLTPPKSPKLVPKSRLNPPVAVIGFGVETEVRSTGEDARQVVAADVTRQLGGEPVAASP